MDESKIKVYFIYYYLKKNMSINHILNRFEYSLLAFTLGSSYLTKIYEVI